GSKAVPVGGLGLGGEAPIVAAQAADDGPVPAFSGVASPGARDGPGDRRRRTPGVSNHARPRPGDPGARDQSARRLRRASRTGRGGAQYGPRPRTAAGRARSGAMLPELDDYPPDRRAARSAQ